MTFPRGSAFSQRDDEIRHNVNAAGPFLKAMREGRGLTEPTGQGPNDVIISRTQLEEWYASLSAVANSDGVRTASAENDILDVRDSIYAFLA